MAVNGVCIAFDDDALTVNPTWTQIDDPTAPVTHVVSWSIDRGRSYELDRTGTGTATITIIDTDGTFDPTNSAGPYYTKIEPLKQAAIALQNPHTLAWTTIFRGFIEDWDYSLDVSEKFFNLTLSLVDALDILGSVEVVPGGYGTTVPLGAEGNVFYAAQQVDDRIKAALADAGWPTGLQSVFSGNVAVQDTIYSPRSTILQVIQDAADAEFPGVANVFVGKDGTVTFHGRLARFDPAGTASGSGWTYNVWHCGDLAACISDSTRSLMSAPFTFNRGLSKVINAAMATPQGIADADIPGQLSTDTTSIGIYGVRSWSSENLLTLQGDETGTPAALAETKKFSDYYKDNFAEPLNRVPQLTFRPQPPHTTLGQKVWALMCGVEIGDGATVTTTHPGGGGFNEEPFFVEGVHYQCVPMNGTNSEVTVTLDLSPQAFFTTNPFS